jgi:hypothetical protein
VITCCYQVQRFKIRGNLESGNERRKSKPVKPIVSPVTAERVTDISLREMCACLHAFREVMKRSYLELVTHIYVCPFPSNNKYLKYQIRCWILAAMIQLAWCEGASVTLDAITPSLSYVTARG